MRKHFRQPWLYSAPLQSPTSVRTKLSCPAGLNKQGVSGLPAEEVYHMPTTLTALQKFLAVPLKFWGLKWPTCEGGQTWR